MSTNGYTNCVEGTFYGFTDTENNEFYPGESLNLQWGSIENGDLPLNISLGRIGGGLVDQIVGSCIHPSSPSSPRRIANIDSCSGRDLLHHQHPLPNRVQYYRKLHSRAI